MNSMANSQIDIKRLSSPNADAQLLLGLKGDKGDTGDKGDKGDTGDTGNGIASITHTGTSGAVKTYTITFTDGTSQTYDVTDGQVTTEQMDTAIDNAVTDVKSEINHFAFVPTVAFTDSKYIDENGAMQSYGDYQASERIYTTRNGIPHIIDFDVMLNTATYCVFYDSNGSIIGRLTAPAGATTNVVVHGSTSDYPNCTFFRVSNKKTYTPSFIAYPQFIGRVETVSAVDNHATYSLGIRGGLIDKTSDIATETGYLSPSGAFASYNGVKTTEFLNLNDYVKQTIFARITLALYGNPNVCVYDAGKVFLGIYDISNCYDSVMQNYEINRSQIISQYPSAQYIRIASWAGTDYTLWVANTTDTTVGYNKLLEYVNEAQADAIDEVHTWSSILDDVTLFNGYMYRRDGSFVSFTGETVKMTDFIDVTQYVGKFLKITARSKYNNGTLAIYDENENVIKVLSNTTLSEYIFDCNYIIAKYSGVKYIRVSSFTNDPIVDVGIKSDVPTIRKRESINSAVGIEEAYIDYATGVIAPLAGSNTSGLIPLTQYDAIYYKGTAQESNAAFWVLYDENNSVVAKQQATLGTLQNYKIDLSALAEEYPAAKYIRVSSIYYPMYLSAFHDVHGNDIVKAINNQNVLFGKKYVACGDSFTEGPFTGDWSDASLYYSYDYQCWKTYPYWIASRNNMDLVNEAKSGSKMYYNGSDSDAFSLQRYKDIPDDADYITLMFGLNETGAPIGTLSDNTNTTVMGAWNVVLSYIIEHHPLAKIGIIIADSWLSSAQHDAQVQIAEYWGIPYLDLRSGVQVPLGINGRLGATIADKAKTVRNETFMISSSDGHPNPNAHKYRSTFIEAWMRTL